MKFLISGIYDQEFLDYTVKALLKAKEYQFKVMIDFHQDVVSEWFLTYAAYLLCSAVIYKHENNKTSMSSPIIVVKVLGWIWCAPMDILCRRIRPSPLRSNRSSSSPQHPTRQRTLVADGLVNQLLQTRMRNHVHALLRWQDPSAQLYF